MLVSALHDMIWPPPHRFIYPKVAPPVWMELPPDHAPPPPRKEILNPHMEVINLVRLIFSLYGIDISFANKISTYLELSYSVRAMMSNDNMLMWRSDLSIETHSWFKSYLTCIICSSSRLGSCCTKSPSYAWQFRPTGRNPSWKSATKTTGDNTGYSKTITQQNCYNRW